MSAVQTIRDVRQLAQQASAGVQAEKRRLEKTRSVEQIVRDRQLTAAGIRLVEQYQPPDIALPSGMMIADVADYRARHRPEYGAYMREPGGPNERQYRARRSAVERYFQFLTSASVEAGGPPNTTAVSTTTFVNVAALEAVTYLLGQTPLWVRRLSVGYEIYTPAEPAPAEMWDAGYFVLAMRAESAYDEGSKAFTGRPYACRGEMWYLKPLDLASHADRRPGDTLPASTVPWEDVLGIRPLVALTGLPTGITLKRTVRWLIGDWVKSGRRYMLPWAERPGERRAARRLQS